MELEIELGRLAGAEQFIQDAMADPRIDASGLPLFVFTQAGSAFDVAVNRAWAGALTLIVIVLLLTVIARFLTRRNRLG